MSSLEKHLHIVSFDVPYPADYGGVIDVFYKIKTLFELGVKIHLHCFEYGRGERPELGAYCSSVNYYKRNAGHKGFSNRLPYIVCSRSNHELLENILKDDYPVLLEGIHSSFFLNDERLKGRMVILRLHNVEHRYYKHLYQHEKSLPKKLYYLHESRLLKKYEQSISPSTWIMPMSELDADIYRDSGFGKLSFVPVFHPFENLGCQEGRGCYCLYHGNLSVAENEAVVVWLLKNVFNDLNLPFVIAGKNPSSLLQKMAHKHQNTCLVANPGEEEMNDIVRKAQINIVPSFNCTGIKLKLLNALFNGRHCISNPSAVKMTGLEQACFLGETANDFKGYLMDLYEKPFTIESIRLREELLANKFNNKKNGLNLIASIW